MDLLDATSDDIRHAYRLLLGREPDPAGLEHFKRVVSSTPHTSLDVARYFLGCAEFSATNCRAGAPLEVEFDGYVMFVGPDDRDIGASVARQAYEPHVAAVVREVLRSGDTFVDVGANIGYFAALGASLVGPSGRVVAIEPMDKNVQLISATIWRNGFNQIEVLPFAASDSTKLVAMATSAGSSNGEVVARATNDSVPVLFAHARTLNDMLHEVDRIDLIKFDIEGHELPAWRGFAEGMMRHRPMVLTEFHPRCMRENAGVEPSDYLDLLFAYADVVEVLVSPSRRVRCRNSFEVISQWEAADRRFGSTGSTHLDLYLRP